MRFGAINLTIFSNDDVAAGVCLAEVGYLLLIQGAVRSKQGVRSCYVDNKHRYIHRSGHIPPSRALSLKSGCLIASSY